MQIRHHLYAPQSSFISSHTLASTLWSAPTPNSSIMFTQSSIHVASKVLYNLQFHHYLSNCLSEFHHTYQIASFTDKHLEASRVFPLLHSPSESLDLGINWLSSWKKQDDHEPIQNHRIRNVTAYQFYIQKIFVTTDLKQMMALSPTGWHNESNHIKKGVKIRKTCPLRNLMTLTCHRNLKFILCIYVLQLKF
jgi:hypothetical protein